MNYREFKEKQAEEMNVFSKENIVVCLGNEEEAIAKLEAEGLTADDVTYLGLGLYLKKEAVPEYESLTES